MERKPMIIYLDGFKKSSNQLYHKKVIYNKNKFKCNSYSLDKNKNSYTKKIIKANLDKSNENTLNIKEYQTLKGDKKSLYSINKNFYKDNFNKTVTSPLNKLDLIIMIQKNVREFIKRKKMKKNHYNEKKKKYLIKTANPNRVQKKLNLNVLEAFKRNSKNQKRFIKLENNTINVRNTINSKKNVTNKNNTLIYINKGIVRKKNYSFDHKKNEEKESKNNYNVEFINIYRNTESNFNNSNIVNKNDNKPTIESELSLSNILNEQQLKNNINTICENETNENSIKIINNNINNNNELLNKKKNNEYSNNQCNLNSKSIFKNKRKLIISDLKNKSYYFSSFQTKENSCSDRNNDNSFILESQRTSKEINNESKVNNIKIKEKNEDDINISGDFYVKDEFDSDIIYQKSKSNLNLINTNIKQNYNPMISQILSNKNKKINDNKVSNPSSKISYKINIPRKNEIKCNNIFESIKEEKLSEFDSDLKSSFYDDEELVIINYDYSLNDKKNVENSLKINTVENINITGIPLAKFRFLEILKKVIYKGIKIYMFNYLKELKNEENEMDKSLTLNDNCSYITQGRIQKNKIIFNYAQIEIKHFINNNNI